ncbi:MAG: serine/threonine protein kinase [Polyangiaceae bacterium]|nr:serine/threonine protein kinase [Polyangiaceae bacterium]
MAHDKGPFEHGDLVGGNEIDALLGTGGFGYVYRARDPRGTTVALKVLRTEVRSDVDVAARLMKEAALLAEIDHPNVVGFHAAGQDGGAIWLAMEYVPGGTLRDRLRKDEPVDVEQALRWTRHVAEGCAEVHKIRDVMGRPVVHRDLKPENVLVSSDGIAKVTDFGIAKFRTKLASTCSNERMGTPHYMAPEQMDGTPDLDERADIYALGVILYEMLAGRRPQEIGHNGDLTLMEVMARSMTQQVIPLPELNQDVPDYAWNVVARMMEKKRDRRFATMRQTADALAEVIKRLRKARGKKPVFGDDAGGLTGEVSQLDGVGSLAGNLPSAVDSVERGDISQTGAGPDASTLVPTSRSTRWNVSRPRLPLALMVVGIIAGITAGVLAVRSWTSPNSAGSGTPGSAPSPGATIPGAPMHNSPGLMGSASASTSTEAAPSASASSGAAATSGKTQVAKAAPDF